MGASGTWTGSGMAPTRSANYENTGTINNAAITDTPVYSVRLISFSFFSPSADYHVD